MEEALPRKIMKKVLAVTPLCEFNALARSCKWLFALAESVSESHADNESAAYLKCYSGALATLRRLPNGVHHGTSTVTANGVEIGATYNRGRLVDVNPSRRAALETLCTWTPRAIEFTHANLPGIFCVTIESVG